MAKEKKDQTSIFSSELKEENIQVIVGKKNQVKGSKNWGTILLNYPIIEGTFYCEVEILEPDFPLPFEGKYEPHVRVGIGPRNINFDRPLGSQQSSFSYRDKDGSFINDSNLKPYGQSYGKGDVIGILVHMFPPLPNFENYQNEQYSENTMLEHIPLYDNLGSYLIFFKNGQPQGIAAQNLKQKFYHVGVSLYMGAKVQVNIDNKYRYFPSTENLQKIYPQIKFSTIKSYDKVTYDIPEYKGIIF